MGNKKSKAGHWFQVGSYALLIGGTVSAIVFTARASYLHKFWRVYRVGPGLPADVILRLAHDCGVLAVSRN